MDLKTASPKEIDAVLAEMWGREQAAAFAAYRAEEGLKALEAKPPRLDSIPSENERRARSHSERLSSLKAEAEKNRAAQAAARVEAEPFEAEFKARGGWRRYFLVVSSANGHVHRERNCSTCNYRTLYSWIVDLADCNERAMVEAYGVRACTTCFPDAPTDPNYREAAPDPSRCEGQPDRNAPGYDPRRMWQRCAECGKGGRLSKHGRLPRHKRAEAPPAKPAPAVPCEVCGREAGEDCAPGCAEGPK